jgi:hypothetical protein
MALDSYYEFTPGQVYLNPHYNNGRYHSYRGMGGCGCGTAYAPHVSNTRAYHSYRGFAGDIGFVANQVWSDMQACNLAWTTSKQSVPQCRSYADAVRAALGQLGYGELPMGVAWGNADMAALDQWIADHGLSPRVGIGPSKGHLDVMEAQLLAGEKPGPHPAPAIEKVSGQYVKTDVARAGMSGFLLIGVVALGAVGALAILKKRKRSK